MKNFENWIAFIKVYKITALDVRGLILKEVLWVIKRSIVVMSYNL